MNHLEGYCVQWPDLELILEELAPGLEELMLNPVHSSHPDFASSFHVLVYPHRFLEMTTCLYSCRSVYFPSWGALCEGPSSLTIDGVDEVGNKTVITDC